MATSDSRSAGRKASFDRKAVSAARLEIKTKKFLLDALALIDQLPEGTKRNYVIIVASINQILTAQPSAEQDIHSS
jgi:hypothetical protein